MEDLLGGDLVSDVVQILDSLKPLSFSVSDNPSLLLENFLISSDGFSGE